MLKSIDENNLSSATFEYADNKKGDAEVISLDEFIIKEKIKNVDLVKIGTEGFEESVIKGMLETIKTFSPTLWIEVSPDSFNKISAVLKNFDYILVDIQGCNLLYKNRSRFPSSKSIESDTIMGSMLMYYDKTNKYYSHYLTAKQWLSNKSKIIESKDKELNSIRKNLVKIQEELLSSKNQIIELKDKENSIEEKLRNDISNLNKINEELHKEKVEISQKLAAENLFSSELEKNFAELKNIIEKKNERIEFLESECSELRISEKSSKIERKWLKENNDILQENIRAKNETIDELKAQKQEIKSIEEKLRSTIKENNDLIESLEKELKVTKAGIESRNKRIRDAENKINNQIKENSALKSKHDEYNALLYQSKKLNAAYERFPSIKLYNWARKHRAYNRVSIENTANSKNEIKQTKELSSNEITEKITEKTIEVKKNEIKSDVLFSDFAVKDSTNKKRNEKSFVLRDDCKNLKSLKVACIMDEFTFSCFSPECDLMQLTPENWKYEIDEFCPDILFVESAWQGNSGKWYGMVVKVKPEFCSLTEYCHAKNIPVVFWNKEDPGHNEGFMAAAGLSDFVFTTEVDCIAQYKRFLGHDRVYFLHFAAQPTLHNPVEISDRKDMFCFAGAYYTNYPERTRVFDNIAHYAMRTKGLDIYDRNFNKPEADHHFPEYYKPFILGTLEADEIAKAYKGYTYNINANSGTWTQTMFARRVFELMASNTVVTGNFSRGLRTLFGDTAITTDSIDEMARYLESYCSNDTDMHRYRLQSHRNVSREDLYEDRLDYIVQKVFNTSLKMSLSEVTVVSKVNNEEELSKIKQMVGEQNYEKVKLYVQADFAHNDNDAALIPSEVSIEQYIDDNIDDGFIAYFDAKDYYAANYISDMMLMLRYDSYDVIGKSAYFNRQTGLVTEETPYHIVSSLNIKRAVVRWDKAKDMKFTGDFRIKSDELSMVSVHEFDYVENSSGITEDASSFLKITDKGISYKKIEYKAEKIEISDKEKGYVINTKQFFRAGTYGGKVEVKETDDRLAVISTLDEDKHTYMYSNKSIEVDKRFISPLWINFEGQTSLDIMMVMICHDENMKRVGDIYANAGLSKKFELPANTKYIKLALRVKGSGNSIVGNVKINSSEINLRKLFLSKSNVLVLTNIYPSYDDLYRNAFVHQRVKEYKKNGLNVDVMCFNNVNKHGYREFEGIDVINGFSDELEAVLESGSIDTVCVHFLDRDMWKILEKFKDRIRILVWCHGSEIQPWWRREFIYETEEELEEGKKASAIRVEFWKNIFSQINDLNIHFVFVSDYFKNIVFEDYDIDLPENKYSIIHNYINTALFDYVPKSEECRKHILSIRPFETSIYANDLTVKCIKELSTREFFKELKFHIVGRGKLFNPLMNELKEYDNVIFENKFLRQYEIAELHKKNGIFMVPTRLDSQGVSRDEAMSSGLVPITNNVAAIPEFVDDTCGMLAPKEDYIKMADDIERLYNDSELFKKMSEAAAERVRNQSSQIYTIDREIELIGEKVK